MSIWTATFVKVGFMKEYQGQKLLPIVDATPPVTKLLEHARS